ncbi:MAG: MXAN_5187 family protein [Archangium sp.]
MARLKFLLFALIALGLWGYHLTQVAPLAVTASVEQAHASVSAAAGPVAVALESQRSLTQAVTLKVATSASAAWNAGPKGGGKPEAPTVDRIASVRSAAQEVLPAELKEQLFVAVVNEVGTLSVKGTGEPATAAPEGVDLNAVATAGTAGSIIALDGASYLAFAVPLAISDKNEVRGAGNIVIALPVLPDAKVLEATSKSFHLNSLALVAENKPVLNSGEAAATTEALGKLKAGANGTLRDGAVREVGPLALPMMVENTAQLVGGRVAIAGTPFEVVATASSKGALDSLAAYQLFAFGGLAGLFLLTIVFTIIMGGQADEGGGMVLPPPMPIPPKRDENGTSSTGLKAAFQPPLEPPPEEPPPPEASPDDFHFPPTGTTGLNASVQPTGNFAPPPPPAPPFEEPTSDPFAQSAPPPPPPPPARMAPPPPPARQAPPPPVATSEAPAFVPSGGGLMDDDEEGQRTVAYPAFKPPPGAVPPAADPFALAAAQESEPAGNPFADNPDTTRVAAVPAELIKAARAGSGMTGERPAIKGPGTAMPKVASLAPAGGGNEEDRHFQEVFRDFVATREKCREPADGLTFDKFKLKLLKNKEQLVAKYQCRTVRFQVYVKDGKAALKATPVKD